MMDRAVASLIALAAACATAAIAVFAGAFALYFLLKSSVGAPGAAGAVALGASLSVGGYAFFAAHRAGARARKSEAEHRELMHQLQVLAGGVAEKHPIATLLVSVAGVVAARRPQLVNELAAIAAQLWKRPPSL